MSLLPSRRWLRWLIWAFLSITALWLLLWAVVPMVVKSQLEKQLTAKLGRTAHVGKVEFSPWSLEATIHELAIDQAINSEAPPTEGQGSEAQFDPKLAQLQIKRIYVNASAQSLRRLAPVLDAIEIDEPVVRLTQRQWGQFDIDDIRAKLVEDSTPPSDTGPAQLALYNIVLRDGRVEFADQSVGRKHVLSGLQLGVPFVSTLASQREIKVQPHLAFDLNGSQFESKAQSTPFLDNRQTAVQLQWSGIDLSPYLGYVPASVPVRLLSGVLDTDLQIGFEQGTEAVVRINGSVALSKVALNDRDNAPLLRFDELQAVLKNVQPLQSRAELQSVRWSQPEIFASRDGKGLINWLALGNKASTTSKEQAVTETAEPATEATASNEPAAPELKEAQKPKPAPNPWQVTLQQFELKNGLLHWHDAATGAASASLDARDLNVQVSDVHWPMGKPLQLALQTQLAQGQAHAAETSDKTQSEAAAPNATASNHSTAGIQLKGSLTPTEGKLAIDVQQLPLQWLAPYISAHFKPELSAKLQAAAGLGWNGSAMAAHVGEFTLDQFLLQDKQAPVRIAQVQVKDAQINLAQQAISIEQIALQKPELGVIRNAQGKWMFEQWLPSASTSKSSPAKSSARSTPSSTKPWNIQLAGIAIDGGAVQFRDEAAANKPGLPATAAQPVALELSALRLRLGAFAPLATKAKPTPIELSAKIGSGRRVQQGSLSFKGDFALTPLAAQGQLQALSLPLHAFEPYFGDKLNVDLVRADGNFKGKLRFASLPKGPEVHIQGDVELNEMRMRSALAAPVQGPDADQPSTKPASAAAAFTAVMADATADLAKAQAARSGMGFADDLLAWKTLAVRGLDLQIQPEKPLNVSVRETALSDFFARVIVQRNGRINLQDIVKTEKSEQSVQQNADAAPADSAAKDLDKKQPSEPVNPVRAATNSEAKPGVTSTANTAPQGLAPIIKVGPIVLTGGKVQFSDYFIQPNYSADLSQLAGRLSEFSSLPPQGQQEPLMAQLELRGRAQGTASLEITGTVNPLAKPLALDIRAQMKDLELSPLSPYSIKYAGHGIERGKLAMDVNYKVQPDGQLTASNKLVLNQLTFGEAVPGAPASLPVRLAVALLADRNGVIDLDLPISGSLNDPQFRLAPIIFKVIGNLITKAITAPFSLLAGAFSGGDESGMVNFAAGSAQLDAKAKDNLSKIVKALVDRPALKMTVVGEARQGDDKEGWKKAELDRLLLAQKRRQVIRDGKNAESVTEISDAERPALVKALYNRADIKKPRNMVGLSKELPLDTMQAMLIDSITVPDDAMRELALARGVAVRDYLATQNLPLERLFLGAPKLDTQDKDWAPRAALSLSTN